MIIEGTSYDCMIIELYYLPLDLNKFKWIPMIIWFDIFNFKCNKFFFLTHGKRLAKCFAFEVIKVPPPPKSSQKSIYSMIHVWIYTAVYIWCICIYTYIVWLGKNWQLSFVIFKGIKLGGAGSAHAPAVFPPRPEIIQ